MNENSISAIVDNEESIILDLNEKLQEIKLFKNYFIIGTELGNIFICDVSDYKQISYLKFSNKSARIKQI